MKNLLIGILILLSSSLFAQTECLFTLNYAPASCFNVQPNLVTLRLVSTSGTVKDELIVNYDASGNVIGAPLSTNGLLSWDGVLTGAATEVVTGEISGITESCILTTQITDNCEGVLYTGDVQSTPINFKPEVPVDCDQVIACVLADIDTFITVDVGLTSLNLDSVTITVADQAPYIFKDTDTWSEPKTATVAGTDDFGNDYAIGATYIEFPGGLKLCVPDKTDLYTDIDLTGNPKTITDPDGDVIEIYDYAFDTIGDGLNVTTDTVGGLITVTYGLDWAIIKDSILSCIPVVNPVLSPGK